MVKSRSMDLTTTTTTTTTKRFRSEEEDFDFISKLPDELLRLILSRLSLKETARTTVLSRRWAPALDLFSGDLFFDENFLGRNISLRRHRLSEPELKSRFVDLVNKILFTSLRSSPTFQRLIVDYQLRSDSASDLDSWILFAFRKRVEFLVLILSPRRINPDGTVYSFPFHLFCDSIFTSLKSLRFEYVAVSEEAIDWILNHCPNLEGLRLGFGCLEELESLRICVPSRNSKLIHLDLLCDLKNLEISSGTLVSLDISTPYQTRFSMEEMTPSLVQMGFQGPLCFHLIDYPIQYSSILTKLKSLKLLVLGRRWNYELLQLNNLKHLFLTLLPPVLQVQGSYLQLLTSFLKGAPFLQQLIIKYLIGANPEAPPRELEKVREKSPYKNLKEVKIFGFREDIRLQEFIFYLIENSLSLEKIVVNPDNNWCEAYEQSPYKPRRWEARRESALRLKSQLPATVNFIIEDS